MVQMFELWEYYENSCTGTFGGNVNQRLFSNLFRHCPRRGSATHTMHPIAGFLIIVLILHFAGFLMPLIYAIVGTVGLLILYGLVKLILFILKSCLEAEIFSKGTRAPKIDTPFPKIASPILTINSTRTDSKFGDARHSLRHTTFSNAPTSGLIVMPEPLEKILSGAKVWEMRSVTTKKRGPIALIQKGSRNIVGTAEIVDVRGPLSDETMIQTEKYHQITRQRLHDPAVVKLRYAWVLSNVRRLNPNVPYVPRKGAVRFVNLNVEEVAALQSQM